MERQDEPEKSADLGQIYRKKLSKKKDMEAGRDHFSLEFLKASFVEALAEKLRKVPRQIYKVRSK